MCKEKKEEWKEGGKKEGTEGAKEGEREEIVCTCTEETHFFVFYCFSLNIFDIDNF
jgi:hypothetical protein